MKASREVARRSICIIVPGYLSGAPRTVKEADALHDAGFGVRVVYSEGPCERTRVFDKDLVQSKGWTASPVRWGSASLSERILWAFSAARRRVSDGLPGPLLGIPALATRAETRVGPELERAASRERADLFIGHYPAGLAAAARAARRWGTRYGYDAEDLHTEEDWTAGEPTRRSLRARTLEERYGAGARHRTAASQGMARALAETYGWEEPRTLYNVFPRAERDHADGLIRERLPDGLSITWFSQTVGADRGLEEAVRAVGRMRHKAVLHLRGTAQESERERILALASDCGVRDRVFLHPQVSPAELFSRVSEHDVGLASEQPVSRNRLLTVTNKVFLYLLAGLAVAATNTPGQEEVGAATPGAFAFYRAGDAEGLAAILDGLAGEPVRLAAMKRAAWDAATRRWNWEVERSVLLESVERAIEAA